VRLLLVVNAMASAVTPRTREVVEQSLRERHEVEVVETKARDDATRLARQAAADGVAAVVVLGGDGTVNEVANGLVGTSTALAVLPGGSTNVFARTIGLSSRTGPAVSSVLDALDSGSIRRIGMGHVNGRFFLFHLGIGFDAAVVHRVEQRADLKRLLGHAMFAYAALDTWRNHYDSSRPRFSLALPDGERIDDGYFAICLKTDPYTFFGPRPFTVAPGTGLDTRLALVVLRDLGAATIVGAAFAALTGGRRLASLPRVELRRDVESVRVNGLGPFPYQVDGDYLGQTESLDVGHRPDCLDLVVPA
jgi:diacylglycerol kinase family enzyme